ncbi:MAG: response regulator, partial [Geobacteraceae bacterium]|nr:response regulator [Geobacteraceae bacterium]
MKVLIVDDNPEILYVLETLLKGHGYRVYSAEDGMAALELLRNEAVDVIVSDVLMPRMDGFQLCRSVKTDERLRHIPFIVYTATYTSPQDEAYALRLGAQRFIHKNSEPENFLATVRAVLEEAQDKPDPHTDGDPLNEEESLRLYSQRLAERLQVKVEQAERELEGRHRVEMKLRESEQLFRSLIETVDDMVYAGNMDGVFTYVSPNWKTYLGIDPESIVGQPFSAFEPYLHPDDADNAWGIAPAVLESGKPYLSPEYRVRYADGSWRWHVSNAAPMRDNKGEVCGIVGVAR